MCGLLNDYLKIRSPTTPSDLEEVEEGEVRYLKEEAERWRRGVGGWWQVVTA